MANIRMTMIINIIIIIHITVHAETDFGVVPPVKEQDIFADNSD